MPLIPLKLAYSAEGDQVGMLASSLPSLHWPALMPCLLACSFVDGWRTDRDEEKERRIGATVSLLHSKYWSRHRRMHLLQEVPTPSKQPGDEVLYLRDIA